MVESTSVERPAERGNTLARRAVALHGTLTLAGSAQERQPAQPTPARFRRSPDAARRSWPRENASGSSTATGSLGAVRFVVRSLLHIDARGLTFTERPDGSRETELQLVTLAFGADGRAAESAGRQHRLGIPAEAFEATLRGGLLYSFETPVARPGGYQVRAAVRDAASGRLGSASQFVEVPELKKGRLVLSGIAMSGGASEVAADPGTTAAVRRFRPGTMVTYAFFAYNTGSQLD
jgi:hypothetical protein